MISFHSALLHYSALEVFEGGSGETFFKKFPPSSLLLHLNLDPSGDLVLEELVELGVCHEDDGIILRGGLGDGLDEGVELFPSVEQVKLVAVAPDVEQHILGAFGINELLKQSHGVGVAEGAGGIPGHEILGQAELVKTLGGVASGAATVTDVRRLQNGDDVLLVPLGVAARPSQTDGLVAKDPFNILGIALDLVGHLTLGEILEGRMGQGVALHVKSVVDA